MSTPTTQQTLETKVGNPPLTGVPAEEEVIYITAGSSLPVYIDLEYLKTRNLDVSQPVEFNSSKKRYTSSNVKFFRKSSTYIVPFLGKFYYYRISPPRKDREESSFWKVKFPIDVRREGFVVINREVYYVTMDDLRREVIRESRKIEIKKASLEYEDFVNNNFRVKERTSASKQNKAGVQDETLNSDGESIPIWGASVDETSELGEYAKINLVHQEQERALLNTLLEEEGWEFASSETEENS